jgi:hypothetical protein
MNYLSYLGIIFILISCGIKADLKPRKVEIGTDKCAKCQMIIEEDHYVVQAANDNGDEKFFDDLGCYVRYRDNVLWNRFAGKNKYAVWITDAESGEWIPIEKAWYREGDISPMNYGIGALKNKSKNAFDYNTAVTKINKIVEDRMRKAQNKTK